MTPKRLTQIKRLILSNAPWQVGSFESEDALELVAEVEQLRKDNQTLRETMDYICAAKEIELNESRNTEV